MKTGHEAFHSDVTIITGTTQGLGAALVKGFASRTDRLITINRRHTDSPEEVLCDLSSKEDVDRTAGELALKLTEASSVLFVLNAAQIGEDQTVSDVTPDGIGKIMYTNVFGQLTLVERLIKEEHDVRVLAIGSTMGSTTNADTASSYAYSASKAALNFTVRNMHTQYPDMNYMLVHPGWVQSNIGGPDAYNTPEQSATDIMNVLDNPANWNLSNGLLRVQNGIVEPW